MKLGEPTLDQIRIFLAIVEHGSFGAAARALGRAVSAISYGVAQMEAQLGLILFEREGSRRPVLTDEGESLLAEARGIADRVDSLLAKAQSLHQGLESRIALVIDVMTPGDATAQILRDFREAYPTVSLKLNVEGLGAVAACLLEREADIAIGGPILADHRALERNVIGEVELVPVASPEHPLARAAMAGLAKAGESRQHLQLVLADRSDLTKGREFSVLSPHTWRLADLGAKHSLLREGLGWGNMPLAMVAADLDTGRLVKLNLPERPGARYTLSALWRRDTPPGPATKWLIEAFQGALSG